jgi:adenylate cyclase
VLKQVEPSGVVPGLPLDDPKSSEKERAAIRAANALAEVPKLRAQLADQRAQLRQVLAGKAALVGWTATAAVADQKPTPLHAAAPGVVIHGVIANAILTGDLWRTAPAWVTLALVLMLGTLTTAAAARLSPVGGLVSAVVLAVGYAAVNCYALFDYGNRIVDLAAPLLAVAGPWAGGTMTRLIIEARERARITRRFSTYVDPDIVNYFLEVRDETMFSGQRRDTAVVFTDLEGFTTLSERLGEDIVPLLNDFMGRAVTVIKRHRGLVNKFLGDGILFFFNAPKPNATYVPDAIDAILDLQVMMVAFNEELAARKLPRLRLRAGVTTGRVIAGDAGTSERADYTVIGDLVNLAARLESANKHFGTSNLVTDPTRQGAGERFLFRPIGVVQVVGMKSGVMVHETLAWADRATDEQKTLAALTAEVVDAFTAGRAADCLAAVAKLEAGFGPSKLTKVYRALCEPYATGGTVGDMPRQIVLDAK